MHSPFCISSVNDLDFFGDMLINLKPILFTITSSFSLVKDFMSAISPKKLPLKMSEDSLTLMNLVVGSNNSRPGTVEIRSYYI